MECRTPNCMVCYEPNDESDCDRFLVKLGSEGKCQNVKPVFEVELRTAKNPPMVTKMTKTQYVNENVIAAAMVGMGGKVNNKGKKGKK